MAQFNPLEIVILGERRHYYSYDGELYTRTFPFEWAENHYPGTGPKECGNCSDYGCWNGVFIGYCANCAEHEYQFERGSGFIGIGKENKKTCDPTKYAFNTYLKDIELDSIGDTDFMDSKQLVTHSEEQTVFYPSDIECSTDTESVSDSDDDH